MAKRKAGLHKRISSIFDGVPLPTSRAKQAGPAQDVSAPPPETPVELVTPPPPPPVPVESAPPALPPEKPLAQPDLSEPQPVAPPIRPPTTPYMPPPPRHRSISAPPNFAQTQTTPMRPAAKKAYPQEVDTGFLQRQKERFLTPPPGISATRQKMMVLLMAGLAISFAIVIVRSLSSSGGSTTPTKTAIPGIPTSTITPAPTGAKTTEIKIDWQAPDPYSATSRDPMYVEPESGSTLENTTDHKSIDLVVKSIVVGRGRPSATIDIRRLDKTVEKTVLVHEGETVLGATVIRIWDGGVEFEKNGKRWSVPMMELQQ